MSWQRIVASAAVVVGGLFAAEADASACITGAGCSGSTPVCDLLSFSCRACKNDTECGSPVSGNVCGSNGACVKGVADAGSKSCGSDSDCDVLSGVVCDIDICIPGCHISALGDTCLVGAHCDVLLGTNLGICAMPDAGGVVGTILDSGLVSCLLDSDCGLASGTVCNAGACIVGCHSTAAGDTCPGGTECSVLGGTVGVCLAAAGDGGITACSKDSDCGTPGLVCDANKCVVGCHVQVGADTCPVGATCNLLGGTLGVCAPIPGDGGVGGCSTDGQCAGGRVCSGAPDGQCVVGCHVSALGDTCLVGAECEVLGGPVGICVNTGTDGGVVPVCTADAQCAAGLVCDGSQCVVGCHDGTAGDTCVNGTHCSVLGGLVGVCLPGGTDGGGGGDGGIIACTQDSDCASGLVCDGSMCTVGCHATASGMDTCASSGLQCDVVGGGLGVCVQPTDGGASSGGASSGASGDDGGEPDATTSSSGSSGSGSGGSGSDGGSGVSTVEGGGCSCSSAGHGSAAGGGAAFLLGLTLLARRRRARR
jgi:MYXO-CTERM domain-containing protein